MVKERECCAACGRHEDDVGRLSGRRLCVDCSSSRAVEAARQMAAKEGEYYERWLRSKGPLGINRHTKGRSPQPATKAA